MEKVYVFKLSGDASGLLQATAVGAGGLGRVGDAADQANAALGRMGQGGQRVGASANTVAAATARNAQQFGQLGVQGGIAAHQMTNLAAQLNDVAVSLAGGQNPFMVFLQQGSQISGIFGGAGNALRAVFSLLSPLRVALGGTAAVLGSVAYYAAQGWAESNKLRDSLILTGNASGLTTGRFDAMGQSIARASGNTVTASREILQALVSSGTVGAQSIGAVATAAAGLQRITGESASTIAADFAAMSNGVAEWARQHNRAWNFITGEQYAYIRRLEAQGQKEKAAQVVMEALTKRTQEQAQQLGFLETSIKGVGEAWDWLKQKMLSIGRPVSISDDFVAQAGKVRDAALSLAQANANGRLKSVIAERQAILQDEQAKLQQIGARLQLEQVAAESKSRQAAKNVQDIAAQSEGAQSAAAATTNAIAQRAAAQAELVRERERVATEQAFERNEISAAAYTERRIVRERAALQAKLQLIDQEAAAEAKRAPGSPQEAQAQAAKAIELDARRLQVRREMVELEGRIAAGELNATPKSQPSTGAQQFSAFERGQQDTITEYVSQRTQAARDVAAGLVATNRQLNIDLITDDRQRGAAQIEAEAEELRKRLDLQALSGDEAKRAADALAEWRVLRERQLTEQLKPEWQRQLEAWQDADRQRLESTNRFNEEWLASGEDAWRRLATTGKVSSRDLVNVVLSELSRLSWRQGVGAAWSGIGGSIWSAITGAAAGGGLTIDPSGYGLTTGGSSLVDMGLGAGRAQGGSVRRHSIHPIVERDEPEVLRNRRGTYLLNGSADGYVQPLAMVGTATGGAQQSVAAPVWKIEVKGAPSQPAVSTTSDGNGGGRVLLDFSRQVRSAMRSDLLKELAAGGPFAEAINTYTGTARPTLGRG